MTDPTNAATPREITDPLALAAEAREFIAMLGSGPYYEKTLIEDMAKALTQSAATPREIAELLPCPFCGSPVTEIKIISHQFEAPLYTITCPNCKGGFHRWPHDEAITAWNRRASGGRHAEDNLFPALRDKHREKTADDVALKSKVARVRAKHLRIFPKSPFKIRSRGFSKRRAPVDQP